MSTDGMIAELRFGRRCNLSEDDQYIRNRMDETLVALRKIEGTGDAIRAAERLIDALQMIRYAHENHVKQMSEDATNTMLYTMEMAESCVCTIRRLNDKGEMQ